MVPSHAVLQDPALAQPQPEPCARDPGRRVDRAAGRHPDTREFPRTVAGLSAPGNRTRAVDDGPAATDRAAAGRRAVQSARGRLPLGAGGRPGAAGRVLRPGSSRSPWPSSPC
ncbi:hypothetical protein G6F63_015465 [Rhizopus arrhizus]|nr:hypothetical protein G6F63_015465 [Rhizopus arrhizus]